MTNDALTDEAQRRTEEERQRAAAAAKEAAASPEPEAHLTAAEVTAAMKDAQAARVAEFAAADHDRRPEMVEALRPRMEAAGDKSWDRDSRIAHMNNAGSEAEQLRLYKQEEARLTAWETRKTTHELKRAEAAKANDQAKPSARDEAAERRTKENDARTEQQRQAHNEAALRRGNAAAPSRPDQQASQPRGDDLRHSSEKQAEQQRHSEARMKRLMELFGGANHEATHRHTHGRR